MDDVTVGDLLDRIREQEANPQNPDIIVAPRCTERAPKEPMMRCLRDPHGRERQHLAISGVEW